MSTASQAYSTIEIASERSFGTVFTVVFAIIGVYPLAFGGSVRVWALAIAAVLVAITVVYPRVLRPLNVIWFKFGMLLAGVVNPIVMLVIYVVTIVPAGLIMKLLRKDLLLVRFDTTAPTYWIRRTPPGPEPESLKDQF